MSSVIAMFLVSSYIMELVEIQNDRTGSGHLK